MENDIKVECLVNIVEREMIQYDEPLDVFLDKMSEKYIKGINEEENKEK
ncbi:MAG: hypothetical protein RSE41_07645 [Clostridia bacterium]